MSGVVSPFSAVISLFTPDLAADKFCRDVVALEISDRLLVLRRKFEPSEFPTEVLRAVIKLARIAAVFPLSKTSLPPLSAVN